jgi:hypothetical protein
MPKNDNDLVAARVIADLEDQHQADAVFVDAGYGTGIVSAGQGMGRDWTLVWFAGASADIGCLNKRAEMWGDMRDWLETGAIDTDQQLSDDMQSPEYGFDKDGRILLERKADMKKRGLASPDDGDALALTFAEQVQRTDMRTSRAPRAQPAREDYGVLD